MLVYNFRIFVSVAISADDMVCCQSGSVPVNALTRRISVAEDTGVVPFIKQVIGISRNVLTDTRYSRHYC